MWKSAKLFEFASKVKKTTGKSFCRQAVEIFKLRCGLQGLGFQEYYELEVFDDHFYDMERKLNCVGWISSGRIDKKLNLAYWRANANDKVLNYALLQHFGYPIPMTIATFSQTKRRIGSELVLHDLADLSNFLTKSSIFPVFIKPIHGSYGRGTFSLKSFDPVARNFAIAGDGVVTLDYVLSECTQSKYQGVLVQKCLKPHAALEKWVGSTTSCVRVIVVLVANIPKVHFAFWKVARAHNITDNFHMGSTGNLLAALNKDTGLVERLVTGLWPKGRSLTHHPDTKQKLVGRTLPDWDQAMALCKSAAICLPGLRLQHWDVAFCKDGPVLMELNTEADLGVPQFLARKPFVDETILQMLENN